MPPPYTKAMTITRTQIDSAYDKAKSPSHAVLMVYNLTSYLISDPLTTFSLDITLPSPLGNFRAKSVKALRSDSMYGESLQDIMDLLDGPLLKGRAVTMSVVVRNDMWDQINYRFTTVTLEVWLGSVLQHTFNINNDWPDEPLAPPPMTDPLPKPNRPGKTHISNWLQALIDWLKHLF